MPAWIPALYTFLLIRSFKKGNAKQLWIYDVQQNLVKNKGKRQKCLQVISRCNAVPTTGAGLCSDGGGGGGRRRHQHLHTAAKQSETTEALKSDQIINLVTLVGESKLAFRGESRPSVCSMLWHGEIMSLFLEVACGLRRGRLFTRWTNGFARGAEIGQNNPEHAHKQAQLRQLIEAIPPRLLQSCAERRKRYLHSPSVSPSRSHWHVICLFSLFSFFIICNPSPTQGSAKVFLSPKLAW